MQQFSRQDFQYLYDRCFSEHDRGCDGSARFLRITNEGVFYDDCLLGGGAALKLWRWKPVHELTGPNKPPSSGPALPFPFTARQLAAFFLSDWGGFFEDAFGRLDSGPNEFILNGEHEDGADAYEALRQAYEIFQDARRVVVELDHEQQQSAHDRATQYDDELSRALEREKVMEPGISRSEYRLRRRRALELEKVMEPGISRSEYQLRRRRALELEKVMGPGISRSEYRLRRRRASAPIAPLKLQAEDAMSQADAALKTWRKAMARQLLQPADAESQAKPAPDTQTQAAPAKQAGTEPPPVVEVPASEPQPDPIPTRDIAELFEGLPYTAANWPRRLSGTQWLAPAMVARGEVGGVTGTWCPLTLARLVCQKSKGKSNEETTFKSLNSRFKSYPQLAPWRDAWDDYYATFSDTDIG